MSTDEKKTTAAQAESTEEIKDEVEAAEINSAAETGDDKKPADKKPGKKDKDKKSADKKAEDKAAEPAEPAQDAKAAAEIAALNDKYLRLYAEYDNFRRRSQKEKEGIYGDAKADTLKEFLPVYDNLVRALATATQDEAYAKGVEMIMTQFNKTMEKLGVTKIESLGQKFDPELHNAVMHADDETRGENEIAEVFQEGFKLGDKVIRFAMVKVAN